MTFEEKLEAAGHVLRRDGGGYIDIFVMDIGYHNGPGCVNCGESWCHHCEDLIEPCIGKEEANRRAKEARWQQYLKLKKEFD